MTHLFFKVQSKKSFAGVSRVCYKFKNIFVTFCRGVKYFHHRKMAKRGGEWLHSGATRGCYPQGMLDLSCRRVEKKKRVIQ